MRRSLDHDTAMQPPNPVPQPMPMPISKPQQQASGTGKYKSRSTSLMVGPSLFSDDPITPATSSASPVSPVPSVTFATGASASSFGSATSPERRKLRRTSALSADAESINAIRSNHTTITPPAKSKSIKRSNSGLFSTSSRGSTSNSSSNISNNSVTNEIASERKGLFEQDDDQDDNDSLESFRERVKVRQIKRKSEIENLKMHLASAQRKAEELEKQLANETKAKEEFAIRANECHKIIEKRNKQLIKASERFTRYTEQTEAQIAELKAALEKKQSENEQKCLELQQSHERELEEMKHSHKELVKQLEARKDHAREELQQKLSQKLQEMEQQLEISTKEKEKLKKKVVTLEQANRDAATRLVQSEEYKNLVRRVENAEAIARGLKHQLQKEQSEKSFMKKQIQRLTSSNELETMAASSGNLSKRPPHPPQFSPSSESERSDAAESIDLATFDYFRLDPSSPKQQPIQPSQAAGTSTSFVSSPTAQSSGIIPETMPTTSTEPAMAVPPFAPTPKASFDEIPVANVSEDRTCESVDTQEEEKQEDNKYEGYKHSLSGSRKMPTNFFEKISIRFKRPISNSADEATMRRVGGSTSEDDGSPQSYVQEPTRTPSASQAQEDSTQQASQANMKPKMFVTPSISSDEESSDSLFDSDEGSSFESEDEEEEQAVSTSQPPLPPLPQEDPIPSRSTKNFGAQEPPIPPPEPSEPPLPEPFVSSKLAPGEPSVQVPLPPLPTKLGREEDSDSSFSDDEDDAGESDEERITNEHGRSKVQNANDMSVEKRRHESSTSSVRKPRSDISRADDVDQDSSSSSSSGRSTSSLGRSRSRVSDPLRPREKRRSNSKQEPRNDSQEDGRKAHRHRERSNRRSRDDTEVFAGKDMREEDQDEAGFSRMNEYMEERARKRMEKQKRKTHKENAESKKKEEYEREWERMAQEEKERRRKHQQQRRSGRRRPASMKSVRVSQMKQQMNNMQQQTSAPPPPPPPMPAGPFPPPPMPPHGPTARSNEEVDRKQGRRRSANNTARDSDSDHEKEDRPHSHSQPVAATEGDEPPLPPEPAAVDPELYLRQQARLRERHEQEMKKKQEAEEADLIRGDIHKRIELWAYGKELLHLILTLDQITALESLKNFQMMVIQSPDNETIRKAYRNIIRVIHPDKLRGVTLAEQLEARELFTVLNKAFEDFRSKLES